MSGGVRAPPGAAEGVAIARIVANELDSAKFDPLLLNGVAKNVNTSLEGFIGRVDALVRLFQYFIFLKLYLDITT
jgi:hypothetical protein